MLVWYRFVRSLIEYPECRYGRSCFPKIFANDRRAASRSVLYARYCYRLDKVVHLEADHYVLGRAKQLSELVGLGVNNLVRASGGPDAEFLAEAAMRNFWQTIYRIQAIETSFEVGEAIKSVIRHESAVEVSVRLRISLRRAYLIQHNAKVKLRRGLLFGAGRLTWQTFPATWSLDLSPRTSTRISASECRGCSICTSSTRRNYECSCRLLYYGITPFVVFI
jgi:hypothetical protein